MTDTTLITRWQALDRAQADLFLNYYLATGAERQAAGVLMNAGSDAYGALTADLLAQGVDLATLRAEEAAA